MDPPIRVISHGRLDTLDDCTEEIWPSKFLVTLRTRTQRNYSDQGQQEPHHYWLFSAVLKIVFLDLFSILALRILINLKQFLPLMLCQHTLHNLLWPLWIFMFLYGFLLLCLKLELELLRVVFSFSISLSHLINLHDLLLFHCQPLVMYQVLLIFSY